MRSKIFFVFLLTTFSILVAQETDISKALLEIESGNIQNAEIYLQEFKKSSPNDPSVIFLDGILTPNGDEALKKYSTVYEKFPNSKYADASLYRIFSYYFSLGFYKKAESYLDKLKTSYPNSSYIGMADRKIPNDEEVNLPNETATEPISKDSGYKYTIQAGAFLNADNAKKFCDQLLKDGYDAVVTTKEIGGSVFNIVNVGKFSSEDETKTILKSLEKNYSVKGRIVEVQAIRTNNKN